MIKSRKTEQFNMIKKLKNLLWSFAINVTFCKWKSSLYSFLYCKIHFKSSPIKTSLNWLFLLHKIRFKKQYMRYLVELRVKKTNYSAWKKRSLKIKFISYQNLNPWFSMFGVWNASNVEIFPILKILSIITLLLQFFFKKILLNKIHRNINRNC